MPPLREKRIFRTFSRLLPDLRLLRRAGPSAAIISGIALTLAIFTFQTSQSWIAQDKRITKFAWLLPSTLALLVLAIVAIPFLVYWAFRTKNERQPTDPYQLFVNGVIAYGSTLHSERRDPALLRLRESTTLTLHVLGFHEERTVLGNWALEAAQFVDDKLAVISILIDDLGWANYLLGKDITITNIEKAIRYAEQLPADFGDPQKTLLLAKAHRHLGVIKTDHTGQLQGTEFETATKLLTAMRDKSPHQVQVDLAHVAHAQALAIASMLGVNINGTIRKSDADGLQLLLHALELVREAREGFQAAHDQGRYAKSLVLEVRLLEALQDTHEAKQLMPLRDRAVAASVWARPAGAAFITGK